MENVGGVATREFALQLGEVIVERDDLRLDADVGVLGTEVLETTGHYGQERLIPERVAQLDRLLACRGGRGGWRRRGSRGGLGGRGRGLRGCRRGGLRGRSGWGLRWRRRRRWRARRQERGAHYAHRRAQRGASAPQSGLAQIVSHAPLQQRNQ